MSPAEYTAFFVGTGLNVFGFFLLGDAWQKKLPASTGVPAGLAMLGLGAGLTLLATRQPHKRGRS